MSRLHISLRYFYACHLVALGIISLFLEGCSKGNEPSGGRIAGKVIMEQNGNPSGVEAVLFLPASLSSEELPSERTDMGVKISQQTDFDHRLATLAASTVTGSDGSFEFTGMPSDSYVLVLWKPDFGWSYVFDVTPPCNLSPIHLWREEHVGGGISEDTAWLADRHYIVQEDLEVPAGVCLTIEPGVWVRFDGYRKLEVKGTLLAEGEETSPVVFTSNRGASSYNTPQPGDWDTIHLDSVEQTSILRWVRVEWASRGISLARSSPQIVNSVIRHCAENGIAASLSSHPAIDRCLIACCGSGVAIESNSKPVITASFLLDNETTGIEAKLYSSPLIANNWIARNPVGVDISNRAKAVIQHNIIEDGVRGVKTYWADTLKISYNIVQRQSDSAFNFTSSTTVTSFTGNNIVDNPSWYVSVAGAIMPDVPAQGNWWGTTDRALISARIQDRNDLPPGTPQNLGTVFFEPFESAPVQEAGLLPSLTSQ